MSDAITQGYDDAEEIVCTLKLRKNFCRYCLRLHHDPAISVINNMCSNCKHIKETFKSLLYQTNNYTVSQAIDLLFVAINERRG